MDLDTIALNPFTPLRRFNTTMGAESPDYLGNGVIVSVPNATFLWLIYNSYYTFDDRKWNYHSVKMPMKLATSYPDIIHIEWDLLLRPNWSETRFVWKHRLQFLKEKTMFVPFHASIFVSVLCENDIDVLLCRWIFDEGKLWDWRDNYCIHLYYRHYDHDHNPESIKKLNTTLGEVFRYIYYGDSEFVFD